MKYSAPPADLFRLTLATLFCAVGGHLADIAKPAPPKSLADHLLSLFMVVTEFYHCNDMPMPAELVTLLKDMHQAAHNPNGAHTLELMRAVHVISHRPGLRNDANVRRALSAANTALIHVS